MAPQTRYAKSGDVHIAYQVVGDAPLDLVLVGGGLTHLEYLWEFPAFAHWARRLASFSRLILFDKRGTGLSDPSPAERRHVVGRLRDAASTNRPASMSASESRSAAGTNDRHCCSRS